MLGAWDFSCPSAPVSPWLRACPGLSTEAGPGSEPEVAGSSLTGDGPMSVAFPVGLNGWPTALGLHDAVSAGTVPSLVARAGNAATDSISAEATPPATTRLTLLNSCSLSRKRQQGLGRPRIYRYVAAVASVHLSLKGAGPHELPRTSSARSSEN